MPLVPGPGQLFEVLGGPVDGRRGRLRLHAFFHSSSCQASGELPPLRTHENGSWRLSQSGRAGRREGASSADQPKSEGHMVHIANPGLDRTASAMSLRADAPGRHSDGTPWRRTR